MKTIKQAKGTETKRKTTRSQSILQNIKNHSEKDRNMQLARFLCLVRNEWDLCKSFCHSMVIKSSTCLSIQGHDCALQGMHTR